METQTPAFGARAASIVASAAENPSSINPANAPEARAEAKREEFSRIPMSVPRLKLSTPEIPGFHCHWINDIPGRLMQAQQAGYEFVRQDETVVNTPDIGGASQAGSGTDLGSRVSVVVGSAEGGEPLRAYLMKIRNEWFEADQRAIAQRVDDIHEAMEQANMPTQGLNENSSDKRLKYAKGTINTRGRSSSYPQRRT